METIRQKLDSLLTEIELLKENDPNIDIDESKQKIESIVETVDTLESNNTELKDLFDILDGSDYLQEIADTMKDPVETNAKLLY